MFRSAPVPKPRREAFTSRLSGVTPMRAAALSGARLSATKMLSGTASVVSCASAPPAAPASVPATATSRAIHFADMPTPLLDDLIEQCLLRAGRVPDGRRRPRVLPVRPEQPRGRVAQVELQERVEARAAGGVVDRRQHLDPAPEVPRAEVGRPDEVLGCAAVPERVYPRVLQEAPEDAPHPDPLGEAGDAG